MKKDIINFKDDYFQILILAFFSCLIGFSYPYLQYGVDGGLVLSGLIKYPDLNSPMGYYYLNSWTSIHQISSKHAILNPCLFSIEDTKIEV